MRRLVVTGIPCAPSAWENFLGSHSDQRIISFYEILEHSQSADPRQMAEYVQSQIELFEPASIVCHDMGVPLTLMSILRMRKRGVPFDSCLTLFNGAFRGVDIFKASHPFRVQLMSTKRAVREVESHGGIIDRRLEKYIGRIRAMYRLIILYGIAEKLSNSLGLDQFFGLPSRFPLKVPVQMIASPNDPYIPFEAIERLRMDTGAKRFFLLEYGHFPYSGNVDKMVQWVEEFETQTRTAKARSQARHRKPEISQEARL